MKQFFLSASALALLTSSALADVSQTYQECRQSEGRLGWFLVTYTVHPKPAPTGHRIPTSSEDLKQSCTAADYEDSREAGARWGEHWPSLQSLTAAPAPSGRQAPGAAPRVADRGSQGTAPTPDRHQSSDTKTLRNPSGGSGDRGHESAGRGRDQGRDALAREGPADWDRDRFDSRVIRRLPDGIGSKSLGPTQSSLDTEKSKKGFGGRPVDRSKSVTPKPERRPTPGELKRPITKRFGRPMIASRSDVRVRPTFGDGSGQLRQPPNGMSPVRSRFIGRFGSGGRFGLRTRTFMFR